MSYGHLGGEGIWGNLLTFLGRIRIQFNALGTLDGSV